MRVLKFGAVWCPSCLVMRPRWKEIEEENHWLKNEYFEFDENKDIVEKYKVGESLPVFIFLDKDDNEFLRLKGEISKDDLLKIINENKDK
jgi:thiol-disulfide isomerase/thioredoxin